MTQALIKQKLIPKQLLYNPTAVIMGKTGAGKTTLGNKLCGTTHKAIPSKGSVTQELYLNNVSCGDHPFALIDTPGTDSSIEAYKHAYLLKAALTATKVNTIFLIIKYDNKFDKIIDSYFQLELPITKYVSNIVVMISQCDQSKNLKNDSKEICESFQEECPDVTNIIFISDKCSGADIANLMYSCLSNMKPQKIEITDEEFYLNFNTYEMKSKVKLSFEQYQKSAKKTEQEYSELITSLESISSEEKDEILHICIIQFREEMEDLLQKFKQQHAGTMMELDWYALYIKLQKENIKLCNEFSGKVASYMSYNLLDKTDPRNLIKRCPNCQLIWYKTEGCDGLTTCGNKSFSSYFDLSGRPFFQYKLIRVSGKFTWQKNEKVTTTAPVKTNKPGTSVGCGHAFEWGKLPKIEEEKILELYQVKTIEEAKKLIKNASFKKMASAYEKTIDKKFHS